MSLLSLNVRLMPSSRHRLFALVSIGALALSLLSSAFFADSTWALGAKRSSQLAAGLDASFAVDWMRLIYDRVKAETVNAPGAARVYAYTGVTLYEAVVPGIPGDVSLTTQIKNMPALPAPDANAAYDWPTVANAALQTVADALLTSEDSHKASAALRAKQVAD